MTSICEIPNRNLTEVAIRLITTKLIGEVDNMLSNVKRLTLFSAENLRQNRDRLFEKQITRFDRDYLQSHNRGLIYQLALVFLQVLLRSYP